MKSLKKISMVCLLLLGRYASPQQSELDAKAWSEDLKFLKEFAEQSHFNLFHTMELDKWENSIKDILENIPKMQDHEIVMSLMRLLAMVKDGHTVLYPPYEGELAFHALPLEFYFFDDLLYVRAALPQYKNLVGKQILKVAGEPIEELLAKLEPHISRDNKFQVQWILPLALQYAEVYGLLNNKTTFDAVEFTYLEGDTEQTISVASGPLQWNPMSPFAPPHWTQMADAGNNLWTKNAANFYWFEYLKENKMVYFQFNNILDKEEESIADFVERLFGFIDNNDVESMVIDLRLNNGGNNFLNKSLIHKLICNQKVNQKDKLFVITGRRTFSAAMNLASDLEQETHAIFVGEPTGSSPNFYGEENNFQLPNSGLIGSISSRYWQGGKTSDDDRKWIAPELSVLLTADDFRNGVDPSMKTILEYLENKY
ncbi:hypothetical protein [Flagellimonas meishanensis]|uniref:hypothetical protein n=1 Tax=Flagellimonas meishanensis TaxID=2873264 RepID=UPI001CA61502|nr:hypothetical protein [[Muricauda] meishanensis]